MCVFGESGVQPHAHLIVERRAGSDAAERSKIPRQRRAGDSALLVALPVGKEKYAVAADGTAELRRRTAAAGKTDRDWRDRD